MTNNRWLDTAPLTTGSRQSTLSLSQPPSRETHLLAAITQAPGRNRPALPVPAAPGMEETATTTREARHGRVLRPLHGPTRAPAAATSPWPGFERAWLGERVQAPPPRCAAPPLPLKRPSLAPPSPLPVLLPLLLAALWLLGEEVLKSPPGGLAVFPLPLALAPLLCLVLGLAGLEIGVLQRLTRLLGQEAALPNLSWDALWVFGLALAVLLCLSWLGLTGHLELAQLNGPLLCDLAALVMAQLLVLRTLRDHHPGRGEEAPTSVTRL